MSKELFDRLMRFLSVLLFTSLTILSITLMSLFVTYMFISVKYALASKVDVFELSDKFENARRLKAV